jgi:hypothetical protein
MEQLVRCKRCNVEKSPSAYSRHSRNKNGLQAYCKPCSNAARNGYRRPPEIKKREREAYRRAFPEKRRADSAVYNALRRGRLAKQPCEVCGGIKVHAHHDDYSNPLAVRWLCPTHHMRLHKCKEAA